MARATRPPRMEAEATHRALAMAEVAGVPLYIVHLSAAEAMAGSPAGPRSGRQAYAETCPQYPSSPTRTTWSRALPARSTSCRRRSGRRGTRSISGRRWPWAIWAGRFDRSLSLQHGRAEGTGVESFAKIPNGRRASRDAPPALLQRRREHGPISDQPLRRAGVHESARMFGLYPKKGTLAPRRTRTS